MGVRGAGTDPWDRCPWDRERGLGSRKWMPPSGPFQGDPGETRQEKRHILSREAEMLRLCAGGGLQGWLGSRGHL